jgi:hypothetical protein
MKTVIAGQHCLAARGSENQLRVGPGNSAVGIIIGANLVGTGIALLALAGSMKDTISGRVGWPKSI